MSRLVKHPAMVELLHRAAEAEALRAALENILDQFNRDNIGPAQAAFYMADIARAALAPATPSEPEAAAEAEALRARVVEHGRRFHLDQHGLDDVAWEACERLSCTKDRAALATPAPATPAERER